MEPTGSEWGHILGPIEKKWQQYWKQHQTFKTTHQDSRPKYYILDMFPYPSGAGLHVGHPLGYIASDVYARFKRHCGFNVLHPMGYDSFGLPAEQYAIATGQHPAVTTKQNIQRYREQLEAIGLSFDWSREISTCDPSYYHFTQLIFLKLYDHWFDVTLQRARPIAQLREHLQQHGQGPDLAPGVFKTLSLKEQEQILHGHRLAYQADSWVNWCPALGTVLANDEIREGFSVRGNHPVEQKKMKQWQLRITAYAQRLLDGLDALDWPNAVKEMQRNWIGRSQGATVQFTLAQDPAKKLTIFTTRLDTIYGVSALVMAPEHDWVLSLTSPAQLQAVQTYIDQVKKKSERQRLTETKKATGVFLGSYVTHPLTGAKIPLWISDYVLSTYGSGVVMSVPAHDERDYLFAQTFELPIIRVIDPQAPSELPYIDKEGVLVNSGEYNGFSIKAASEAIMQKLEQQSCGQWVIQYRLHDATFSRQRYWGEPIPIYYDEDQVPHALDPSELPLVLPEIDRYLPTEQGDPPLARATQWKHSSGGSYETTTMPGFAGSCAYYLRYMDPHNQKDLASSEAIKYWKNVDFYLGGSEHATGHLLYSRFWYHFLLDLGLVQEKEPFQKLFNQGMILGRSQFVYRIKGTDQYVCASKKDQYDVQQLHVDVKLVYQDFLDLDQFKTSRPEYQKATFILGDDGRYRCGVAVEKMSKSFFNVVNPDDIIQQYGADAFRLYEMFLGPLDQSKPWNTNGIEGVSRFLAKSWKMFEKNLPTARQVSPSPQELSALHRQLKKYLEDLEAFALNTCVSGLMVLVNELTKLPTLHQSTLETLAQMLSPFAPHMAEEMWERLGHSSSISTAKYPAVNTAYLVEDSVCYPVSFNGKTRFTIDLPTGLGSAELEARVMALPETQQWLQGKKIQRVVVVPGRIINIVLG